MDRKSKPYYERKNEVVFFIGLGRKIYDFCSHIQVEDLQDIKAQISSPKKIVIISHRNPDGDAIGSSLGLAGVLAKQSHAVKIVLPSDYPLVFNYLDNIDDIVIYDSEPQKALEFIKEANLIFCLDFNSLERVSKMASAIEESEAKIIMIDHHIEPEPFYDYGISIPAASSTSEMIYEFLEACGYLQHMDISIGEALFTGILTDTGSFRHNTNKRTYEIAGALKNFGIDDYYLQDKIFNSLEEKQLRILGHCLANRMEILEEYRTGIIALNKFDFENFNIQRGDTEGIVNYILMMKKMDVAIFITQQPTIIKISFRSKGDISVQALARDHFRGGGHKNAAGGAAYGALRTVIEKVKEVLPNYVSKAVEQT